MGYYTDYDYGCNKQEIIEAIDQQGFDSDGGQIFGVKWYDCFDDVLEVSKKFPDDLIIVEGVGEEFPDVWKAYFKNGKHYVEQATISFKAFEADKLT